MRQAFEVARDLSTGVVAELRISAMSLAAIGPSFGRIRDTFHDRHPGCRVWLRETNTLPALEDLRTGALDLVVSWLPPGPARPVGRIGADPARTGPAGQRRAP